MNLFLAAIGRSEIADYVDALFLVYIILIFVRILLSWIPRIPYNPILSAVIGFVTDVTDRTCACSAGSFRRWAAVGSRSTSARSSPRSC